MNKLDMQTPDLTGENIDKIAALFPEVVTEKEGEDGATVRVVDFDLLRQLLSKELAEVDAERYRLDWPGKKRALFKANTPITKTLRPVREESVDFDTTQNLFIEGDNFEALKILQESYLGKVKMIYIDPPYNTGKDFVYSDKHTMDAEEYTELTGAEDEEGNKMFKENTRTNPRFHSDWLSMMYERLIIARDLLRDDGVIFISIDDNEAHNLRKICDEIYGEDCFIADIIWNSTKSVTNTALISEAHTHTLVYSKQIDFWTKHREQFRLPESGEGFSNPDNDPRGPWKADPFQVGGWRPNQQYEITNPNTGEVYLPSEGNSWKNEYDKFVELMEDKRIVFGTGGEAGPQRKRFLSEALERGRVTTTLWTDVETTTNGTQQLKKLFEGGQLFTNPKPVGLLMRIITLATSHSKDALVLDFFSGSATTAHAAMQQNAEDGGNRKFIMVQLAEETPSESEARKAGYENIAQLGRERIRRAGAKIRTDYADKLKERTTPLDTGFRTYRVDDTNMKDVFYHPTEMKQSSLLDTVDNIKEDRSPEDLLTQVMLDLGLTLDLPIEARDMRGNTVYVVANGALVACFDTDIDFSIVDDIAALSPLKLVFRDASFKTDADRINLDTRMKRISPDTTITVL
jgi:adenine-specific DNA-methyltransferase